MSNLDERISTVDAKLLIGTITTLARSLSFTRRELIQICKVCEKCIDRLERENDVSNYIMSDGSL